MKAAQTLWNKFARLPARMTPDLVLKLKVDDMRAVGLSARKVDYLVDLAMHFTEHRLHQDDWQGMSDEAIVAELMSIRGVGRWTAEMFLIFYLQRPNVLPLDDAGLISGISQNYFSGDPVSRSEAREVAEAWKPWCTVATWYIGARSRRSLPPEDKPITPDQPPFSGRNACTVPGWDKEKQVGEKNFLDFEQPIAELESKIEELRYVQTESAVDISEEIEQLSKRACS